MTGKKDDDAFYFSINRPGQKILHLRTFSPVDGIEWVRAVAACKATVMPAHFLESVGGALSYSGASEPDLAASNSTSPIQASSAAAAPATIRVAQSERLPTASPTAPTGPVRKGDTMPTRVGADPHAPARDLGADASEDSSDDHAGTRNFSPPAHYSASQKGGNTAAAAATAAPLSASPAKAPAAATASPPHVEHYHQVPQGVTKLPLATATPAPAATTTTTTAAPTATTTPPPASPPVAVDFDCHATKPWFRPDLTRVGAVEFLENKAVGCFIIRLSSQNGCLCISHVEQNSSGTKFVGHGIIHQWRGPPPARYGWSIEQVQATYPTLEALLRSLPLVWEADSAYSVPASAAAATSSTPPSSTTPPIQRKLVQKAPSKQQLAMSPAATPRHATGTVQCEQLARTASWPAARRGHSLVALGGGAVLLLGGAGPSGRALGDDERVWLLTVRGSACTWERWRETSAVFPAVSDFGTCGLATSGASAAVVVDDVYVFGGRTADGRVSGDLLCLSAATKQVWAVLPESTEAPAARHSHSFVMMTRTTALLVGGQAADGQICKDSWLFDTQSRKWTELSLNFKPSPRFAQAAVSQHGTVAIIGGVGGGATATAARADVWSLSSGTWRLACGAAPFGERSGAAAAAVVFGAGAGGAPTPPPPDDDDDPLAALTAMAEAASERHVGEQSMCLFVGGMPRAEYLDDNDDALDRRLWLAELAGGPAAGWEPCDVAVPLERRQGAALVCVRSGCAFLFGGALDTQHVLDDAYLFTLRKADWFGDE